MLKIVVDAMGGDNAPAAIVQGAVLALKERKDFAIVLTGDENLVRAELKKCDYDASRIEVVHCTEVITNDDVPTSAVRTKRGSSLVVGLKILREDEEAGAFVSAGSTGAVLAGGIMYLGRIKGVMRPALCPAIPNVRGGKTLLCDAGANAECKPPYLVQLGSLPKDRLTPKVSSLLQATARTLLLFLRRLISKAFLKILPGLLSAAEFLTSFRFFLHCHKQIIHPLSPQAFRFSPKVPYEIVKVRL